MSLSDALNISDKLLSVALKLVVIIIGIAVIGYFALSIIADRAENRIDASVPSVNDAQYQFKFKTMGIVVYTDKYDTTGEGKYILHGFYNLDKRGWKFHKTDLPLDEHYFGDIIIERR